MTPGFPALTEKEKQTLRLLLTGHDAKSIARHLELSVHTINERLRDARRKLSASSSKEAARLLCEAEGADPHSLRDKQIGDALHVPASEQGDQPIGGSPAKPRTIRAIGGFVMISFALALLALSASTETAHDPAALNGAETRPASTAETAVTGAARQWLSLVDAAKWQESWAATGQSFRSMNSVETWQSVSNEVRVPLGRILSRRLIGEQNIPAPPNGYQVVRFQTDFANKAGATETLSLAREDGSWKVAGYVID